MENSLSETLKNQIHLIEGALDSDKYKRNAEYQKIINKTQSREAVYEKLRRKFNNLDEKADELCEKCAIIMEKVGKDLKEMMSIIFIVQNKRELKIQIDSLTQKANTYYAELGQLILEYGLLDVLIERNDTTLNKLGIPILKIDRQRAMEEFKAKPYIKTSYTSELMKILFYTNKIAKFIQDIEFGIMLNNDRMNSSTSNDKRIQLLSNLKTHYLNMVVEEKTVFSEEKQELVFEDEEKQDGEGRKIRVDEDDPTKKEFLRLFGNDFDNLDYEQELENARQYYSRVKKAYSYKTELTELILAFGLHSAYRKFIGQDIKCCGICRDEKGNYVLGMNIQGYFMQLTGHVATSLLVDSLKHERDARAKGVFLVSPIEIEQYEPLLDINGKVVKTNLLYRLNKAQMDGLREIARKRPDDPVIQYYCKQISKDINTKPKMITEKELFDK